MPTVLEAALNAQNGRWMIVLFRKRFLTHQTSKLTSRSKDVSLSTSLGVTPRLPFIVSVGSKRWEGGDEKLTEFGDGRRRMGDRLRRVEHLGPDGE